MFMRADRPGPLIPWIDQLRNDASEILEFLKFATTATKPFIRYQYHRALPYPKIESIADF